VNAAADEFKDVSLPSSYQGFTKVVTALEPIRAKYGSIDQFIDQRLIGAAGANGPQAKLTLSGVVESFVQTTKMSGLDYGDQHQQLVIRLLASLMTRPFVILTGLSGSGKSQLALKLGHWFGKGRYEVVSVRPDWTGPEAMLGYEDLLQPAPRPWVVGDVLKLSLKAAADPGRPYLLLLDEMNLAHVERYFADFLSGMESGEGVLPNLAEGESDGNWRLSGEAAKIPVPGNLFVVGTVNVDETTYMFSPKVLDRANTIEFRVMSADLAKAGGKPGFAEGADVSLLESLVTAALDPNWHRENRPAWSQQYEEAVGTLHQTLSVVGWEFGYRTYYDMLRFAAFASAMGVDEWRQILDIQVLQKVLPRLNGSKRRLEPALSRLGRFCQDLVADDRVKDDPTKLFMPFEQDLQDPALPMTYDKIRRMHRLLVQNQFASFAE
jgi:5-methylcytosine-specific restriction protein B